MTMRSRPRAIGRVICMLLLLSGTMSLASAAIDDIPADLPTLIREAADTPNQFAVNVAHAASLETAGEWSNVDGKAVWRYSARIATAVSLSFHARSVVLPASASMVVRSAETTAIYSAADVSRGELWSRVQPGDTLDFTLEVPAAEKDRTRLDIVSFQAGYRGLSPGVRNHAQFNRVRAMAAGDPDRRCLQVYACVATPANAAIAKATVAVLVGNQYQCSGTLTNNTSLDNTPYLLTARHCQRGKLGGGAPDLASYVIVYWNAEAACGDPLDSIYRPSTARQVGGTTVVEQEDAWLIRLDSAPPVNDARFAGFDVSGGTVMGGYTVHHALGYQKQFTGWNGPAYAHVASGLLGTTYLSHLLQTSNVLGAIGPGASGAALANQDDRQVGVLTLGERSSSTSGYGNCPGPSPSVPDGQNGEADFTSLAAIWNSTADTTSTTGSVTLKSVLDPGNTGALTLDGLAAARLDFFVSRESGVLGSPVTLTWNAPTATSCTATGGASGDGWAGSLPPNGSQSVQAASAAEVSYRIRCQLPGGASVSKMLALVWAPPLASPRLTASHFSLWATRPLELKWESNVGPCSLSGGSLSLTNLPATGTATTTSATPGDITYTLTCGTPGFTGTTQQTVPFVAPGLIFIATSTRRHLGEPLRFAWYTQADSCAASGGAPNDGWNLVAGRGSQANLTATTVGTYTYTLVCSSGPLSVQKSITIAIDNGPGFVEASLDRSTVTLSNSPSDNAVLHYRSNLSNCSISGLGWLGASGPAYPGNLQGIGLAEQDVVLDPTRKGTYTLSISCSSQNGLPMVTSLPLTLTVQPPLPPTATISVSPTSTLARYPVTVTWSSTDATSCVATGAIAIDAGTWDGDRLAASGTRTLGPYFAGDYTLGVRCASIDDDLAATPAAAQTVLHVDSTAVTMTNSPVNVTKGQSFTLSWSAASPASCTASGGGANGTPWSGAIDASGSITQTATTVGTYTYSVNCGPLRTGSTAVVVNEPAAPPPSSGGGGSAASSGGGGGGSTDLLVLLGLGALAMRRTLRRQGEPATAL